MTSKARRIKDRDADVLGRVLKIVGISIGIMGAVVLSMGFGGVMGIVSGTITGFLKRKSLRVKKESVQYFKILEKLDAHCARLVESEFIKNLVERNKKTSERIQKESMRNPQLEHKQLLRESLVQEQKKMKSLIYECVIDKYINDTVDAFRMDCGAILEEKLVELKRCSCNVLDFKHVNKEVGFSCAKLVAGRICKENFSISAEEPNEELIQVLSDCYSANSSDEFKKGYSALLQDYETNLIDKCRGVTALNCTIDDFSSLRERVGDQCLQLISDRVCTEDSLFYKKEVYQLRSQFDVTGECFCLECVEEQFNASMHAFKEDVSIIMKQLMTAEFFN